MLSIAVVEDNPDEAEVLRGHLKRYGAEAREAFSVRLFKDAIALLSVFNSNFDIIFLDIDMPDMNGIEAAKKIRLTDSGVIIVFVTSLAQYAIEGYEVNAFSFLIKPLAYAGFSAKLSGIINEHKRVAALKGECQLAGKTGIKRLEISSIKYVEVQPGHHLLYHTLSGVIDVCGSLKDAEEKLKSYSFSKCNSCYLVNLRYVSEVRANSVVAGGTELQMSRRRKSDFINDLTVFLGEEK